MVGLKVLSSVTNRTFTLFPPLGIFLLRLGMFQRQEPQQDSLLQIQVLVLPFRSYAIHKDNWPGKEGYLTIQLN